MEAQTYFHSPFPDLIRS